MLRICCQINLLAINVSNANSERSSGYSTSLSSVSTLGIGVLPSQGAVVVVISLVIVVLQLDYAWQCGTKSKLSLTIQLTVLVVS